MPRLADGKEPVRRSLAALRSRAGAARHALETPRGRLLAAAAAVAMIAVVAVVAISGEDPPPPAAEPGEASAELPAPEADVPRAVSSLLEEMPVERKVAQLMLVGFEGVDAGDPVFDALEDPGYGGIVIADRSYVSADQVAALSDEAVSVARDADQLAPWVMAPQEGGEFNALPDLPPADAPAELASAREAAEEAEEAADALLDVGVTGVLAPVVDIGTPQGGALGERAYSDLPERVRAYAVATIRAYEDAGLFSAAKHFPGLGGASQSTELGPANVGLTLDQLAERDLIPFEAAIDAGVPGIVVGHGLYGVDDFVTPASASETMVADVLRDRLGFEGVAIADDLTAPGLTAVFRPTAAAVDAVRVGIDMVYVSEGGDVQSDVYDALLAAVRDGRITEERLDEAVTRNVLAKREAGLLAAEEEDERDRAAPERGDVIRDSAKAVEGTGRRRARARAAREARDRASSRPRTRGRRQPAGRSRGG